MSGWSYECPCGWSARQADGEEDAVIYRAVDAHKYKHALARYALDGSKS